jgi:hypothetical protein
VQKNNGERSKKACKSYLLELHSSKIKGFPEDSKKTENSQFTQYNY